MTEFQTPILFIIFNRPDTTRAVFEEIKKIKPSRLFIAADGPRKNKPGEVNNCEQARQIEKSIDWPCEVHKKFSDVNLGCKIGVSSAINWFFENVTEGIILEDDCLPNSSFFNFCQQLLYKYRNINEVKMISGSNFRDKQTDESYYFSRIPHIWGWATWKRAWSEYDLQMKAYPDFKKNNSISKIFRNKKIQRFWIKLFDKLYQGAIDTWDGQWVYTIYRNNGLSISPGVNMISNIGFGENATHTKGSSSLSNLPKEDIEKITHPEQMLVDAASDDMVFKKIFYSSIFKRIIGKIKHILKI